MAEQPFSIPSEPIPESLNRDMARVFAYWRDKCAGADPGPFPRLSEINVIDLHDIAAHLLISDVIREEDAGRRYCWRFWGSNLTDFFGVEMTGKFIDQAYTPSAARQIIASYEWIMEHREPHYWVRRGGLAYDDQEHLRYERLICPILGPSGDIDHLFGIITFVGRPARHYGTADFPTTTKASISADK